MLINIIPSGPTNYKSHKFALIEIRAQTSLDINKISSREEIDKLNLLQANQNGIMYLSIKISLLIS